MKSYLIVAGVSYLLGSIPFGYLLAKRVLGLDIRTTGSGNIGATNVARTSRRLGLVTLLLDAAKGFVAVTLAPVLAARFGATSDADRPLLYAIAAFASITGHIFSVWLRFRGGKGVATAVGAFLAMDPAVIGLTLALFAALAIAFRYVSFASITAVGLYPALAYWFHRDEYPPVVIYILTATAVMIIARHHTNIRRLLAGTEPRFPLKRKPA
jgi:acyl phosphate:glycerol-3-phosphate acyltransferase